MSAPAAAAREASRQAGISLAGEPMSSFNEEETNGSLTRWNMSEWIGF
jgi:hypothetical protein